MTEKISRDICVPDNVLDEFDSEKTTPHIPDWESRFIGMADYVSRWSKDPSTKVGAVLISKGRQVLSTGFNGFPFSVDESGGRWTGNEKYSWVCHAERNSLDLCDSGAEGATLYLNWEPTPCVDCTKAVIQNRVAEVVGPDRPFGNDDAWNFAIARDMLEEAGVNVRVVSLDDLSIELYGQGGR